MLFGCKPCPNAQEGNLVDERLEGTSSCLFGNPSQVFVIFMGMSFSRHLLTMGHKEKSKYRSKALGHLVTLEFALGNQIKTIAMRSSCPQEGRVYS